MSIDFAKRADDHNYNADYIIRTLDDNDYYKLLMLQLIWKYTHLRDVPVTFSVINRTVSVRLAEIVDIVELDRQLAHVEQSLRWEDETIDALRGQAFHGTHAMFEPAFLNFLKSMRLCSYKLGKGADGQLDLTFTGTWAEATMWELYGLPIIGELRTREGLKTMDEQELDIFFARAKIKLWDMLQRLKGIPGLKLADFGTRRRFSHLWQRYVVEMCGSVLGEAFTGTSNFYMARQLRKRFRNMEAIGTNAHELPMVLHAMSRAGLLGDIAPKDSPYEVLRLWQEMYGGALRVFLPDTFGTTNFLRNAPDWVAEWTGMREDSKDPHEAGEEYIAWLKSKGKDPTTKLLLFSDGLDVDTIIKLHAQFAGVIQPGYSVDDFTCAADFLDAEKWLHQPRIRVAFGWGTMLTNAMHGCHPRGLDCFKPISLVCKVTHAAGLGAVKLSNNYTKATGAPADIDKARKTFGSEGMANIPVTV
jgi:nicotinate phosphoribosyltransferase